MTQIAPSMLAADFLHLEKDVELVNNHADLFHLDIMDGTFVPNISYGFPIVEAIAKKATKPMDAHLMIIHPEKYVERFAKVGVQMLSFHLNAVDNAGQVLAQIRAAGHCRSPATEGTSSGDPQTKKAPDQSPQCWNSLA